MPFEHGGRASRFSDHGSPDLRVEQENLALLVSRPGPIGAFACPCARAVPDISLRTVAVRESDARSRDGPDHGGGGSGMPSGPTVQLSLAGLRFAPKEPTQPVVSNTPGPPRLPAREGCPEAGRSCDLLPDHARKRVLERVHVPANPPRWGVWEIDRRLEGTGRGGPPRFLSAGAGRPPPGRGAPARPAP